MGSYSRRVPKSAFSSKYELFRRLLVDARTKNNLSQVELGQKLCRPQSFVSKYERGERRLDVIEFEEVAKALQIDPIRFLKRVFRHESSPK